MNITYIIIWGLLVLLLKYDLKLSNIKTILRATLFTLLAYNINMEDETQNFHTFDV